MKGIEKEKWMEEFREIRENRDKKKIESWKRRDRKRKIKIHKIFNKREREVRRCFTLL